MLFNPRDQELHQRLLLTLILGWVLLLALPMTRELEVLNLRVLFGLNGETIVETRGPYGGLVPSVDLPRRTWTDIRRNAPFDESAYLLTGCCPRECPMVSDPGWRDERFEVWVGLSRRKGCSEGQHRYPDWLRPLIRDLEQRSPQSGELWAVSAQLDLDDGEDRAAIADLEESARRPTWQMLTVDADIQTQRLLIARGLPPLDAAVRSKRWVGMMWISATLDQLFTRAYRDGDPERLGRLVRLVPRLDAVRFQDGRLNELAMFADAESSTLKAVKNSPVTGTLRDLSRRAPRGLKMDELTWALLPFVDARDVDRLAEVMARCKERLQLEHDQRARGGDWSAEGRAQVAGFLHEMLAAVLISLIVLGIPFSRYHQAGRGNALRSPRFWTALFLAGAVSVWVLGFLSRTDAMLGVVVPVARTTWVVLPMIGGRRYRLRPLAFAIVWMAPFLLTGLIAGEARLELLHSLVR